mmetsp:Transcript_24242/g.56301  ORF Transcript_24242/g.56301 Transcript_24242/m.56301 type:complete len:134 (-) Transcript_24242:1446-1847(-)
MRPRLQRVKARGGSGSPGAISRLLGTLEGGLVPLVGVGSPRSLAGKPGITPANDTGSIAIGLVAVGLPGPSSKPLLVDDSDCNPLRDDALETAATAVTLSCLSRVWRSLLCLRADTRSPSSPRDGEIGSRSKR